VLEDPCGPWDLGVAGLPKAYRPNSMPSLSPAHYSTACDDPTAALRRRTRSLTTASTQPICRQPELSSWPRAATGIDELFEPYHRRIAAELDSRLPARAAKRACGPAQFQRRLYAGVVRPWPVGVLHWPRGRLAGVCARTARERGSWWGRNQPLLRLATATDYTWVEHR